MSGNFPGCLETCQIFWRISRFCGNFLACLETCQISGRYPGRLERFRLFENVPSVFHKLNKSVLQGVCQQEKFYFGKQDFLNIALKLLCKTPSQAIVKSMGSMLVKHTKPERNASQSSFEGDMHIDWNGPVVSRAELLYLRGC